MKLPKKILIFRFSAMGDVAMTVPVISVLQSRYPQLEITLVSRPFFAPLFKDIPKVNFIGIDFKNEFKGFKGLLKLFFKLKDLQPDAIADLHDVLRSKVLVVLFKIFGYYVAVIDKGRADKKALTREKNKVFKPLKTTHQRYAEVFESLGFSINLDEFKPIKPQLSSQVSLFLQNFSNKPIIGIAPFAAHKGKQYPIEKIKELLILLRKHIPELNILLLGGGEKEKKILDKLEAIDRNHIVNITGVFSFEEELQVISKLNLMISMDSANGHLAALYGIPVLTIWGVTHPYAGFTPINQPIENQITADLQKFPQLPTSIYGNKTFKGYEKIWEDITHQIILNKIKNILECDAP